MKKLIGLMAVIGALSLQGCNNEQPIQTYAQQPIQAAGAASSVSPTDQPQVVYQQAPSEDHTVRDGLIGAGVGYLLGRHTAGAGAVGNGGYGGGGGSYHAPPTVVHNNTVVKKVYVQQNVKQVVRPPRPTTSPKFSQPKPTTFRAPARTGKR